MRTAKELIRIRSDYYAGDLTRETRIADGWVCTRADVYTFENRIHGYAAFLNGNDRRFLHVLVNTVKDFKDKGHDYKRTGVAESYRRYRMAQARMFTTEEEGHAARCTPSNMEVCAWFNAFHLRHHRRMKLKAMQYSFKVR